MERQVFIMSLAKEFSRVHSQAMATVRAKIAKHIRLHPETPARVLAREFAVSVPTVKKAAKEAGLELPVVRPGRKVGSRVLKCRECGFSVAHQCGEEATVSDDGVRRASPAEMAHYDWIIKQGDKLTPSMEEVPLLMRKATVEDMADYERILSGRDKLPTS